MAARAEQTASFMMLCLGDFSSKLCIPAKFVTKYRQQFGRRARVTLETGDGKSWEVKIEDKNADLYLKDGWPEFVKDNQIDGLDFLTFRLLGGSAFKVTIYTADGCARQLITSPISGGNHVKKKRRRCEEESNPLYFEVHLKPHHLSRLNLSKRFSKAAGLEGKEYVKLENVGTRNCEYVVLDERLWPSRIDLASGWREFREANGLNIGKTFSFRFNPGNGVIHVEEVIKNGN